MKKIILTEKTMKILDMIGYNQDRVYVNTSKLGWVIGRSRKFVALGMTKEEGLNAGFLEEIEANPLYDLASNNVIIPHEWIRKFLSIEQYGQFVIFMSGQAQSDLGVFNQDLLRFLNRNNI